MSEIEAGPHIDVCWHDVRILEVCWWPIVEEMSEVPRAVSLLYSLEVRWYSLLHHELEACLPPYVRVETRNTHAHGRESEEHTEREGERSCKQGSKRA